MDETLTQRMKKNLDGNYIRMLRTVLNKSWKQPSSCTVTYFPFQKNIQVRPTKHAGFCRRSKDEIQSHILLLTPTHGRASVGRLVKSNIYQLYADTVCSPEDLPKAMDNRDE